MINSSPSALAAQRLEDASIRFRAHYQQISAAVGEFHLATQRKPQQTQHKSTHDHENKQKSGKTSNTLGYVISPAPRMKKHLTHGYPTTKRSS